MLLQIPPLCQLNPLHNKTSKCCGLEQQPFMLQLMNLWIDTLVWVQHHFCCILLTPKASPDLWNGENRIHLLMERAIKSQGGVKDHGHFHNQPQPPRPSCWYKPSLDQSQYLPPRLPVLFSWPRDGHLITAGLIHCLVQDFYLCRAQISFCVLW